MQRSYIDYAMTVIVGRALPDVRDGLKPVHRRVLYAMYDGGYRPDRGFSKCSRVVGDVMGQYHPHGDTAIYDTLVRLAQPWVMRAPLVDGQGNFGSPGNDPAAAMRYTECRMAPLAMEMVRDIDEDTVDFTPNYDGRSQEPTILPARFPNLLVNGSAGIAVGMATNIPPHNLREVAEGVQWALEHPDATREELLEALLERIKGPDFPTERADRRPARASSRPTAPAAARSRCARSSTSRRTPRAAPCSSITELPYQVNPDNLALKIAELADSGKIQGIADVRDDSLGAAPASGSSSCSSATRSPGSCSTTSSSTPSCRPTSPQHARAGRRRAAHADPRPVRLALGHPPGRGHPAPDPLPAAQGRGAGAHLPRPGQGARRARRGHRADPRAAPTSRRPATGLMALLDIDELQARAILDMQLRRLAALERQKIIDRLAELEADHRRPRGHPRQPSAAAADHLRRARRDRRQVRRRAAQRRSSPPTATCRWRT